MADFLITNARIVSDRRTIEADLRIVGDRIDHIFSGLEAKPGERVIDAAGRYLLPGMIDDQVHFREPGLEHKADIATESRAAVAGGITSFMEMPNTKPTTTTFEALDDKYARAARSAVANYSFYFGATNENLETIKKLKIGQACGIKIFMGASTGNMLVDNPEILDKMFRYAPLLIVTHCEDTPTIDANLAREKAQFGDQLSARRHPYIRSREACLKSSQLATSLARKHRARLHVLHISTADELDLFQPGPISGKTITAETCVHFLRFDEADYDHLGNRLKCNPSVKAASDRAALIEALADGRIDILATDHAPHTIEEKAQPYEQAPGGLPLVQDCLLAALECVHEGSLSMELLVERACHSPARLFGVKDRGWVREGAYADLVLVDTNRPHRRLASEVLSKCGWSPFENYEFRSTIAATWVNGHLAYDDGKVNDSQLGRRLDIGRGRE